jgi:8-hydroxy-5-deazaflavin:NADPH oxidoreductase
MSAFIESLGLRPLDTGDLKMAHWLVGAGLLMVGLGRYGVGNYRFSLGVNIPHDTT